MSVGFYRVRDSTRVGRQTYPITGNGRSAGCGCIGHVACWCGPTVPAATGTLPWASSRAAMLSITGSCHRFGSPGPSTLSPQVSFFTAEWLTSPPAADDCFTQFIQQHLRLLQVGDVKSFNEHAVSRSQQIDSPAAFAPAGQRSRERRGCAKFKQTGALSARRIQ
jgi:hypothetical protein